MLHIPQLLQIFEGPPVAAVRTVIIHAKVRYGSQTGAIDAKGYTHGQMVLERESIARPRLKEPETLFRGNLRGE
jgi:hypothetical protein